MSQETKTFCYSYFPSFCDSGEDFLKLCMLVMVSRNHQNHLERGKNLKEEKLHSPLYLSCLDLADDPASFNCLWLSSTTVFSRSTFSV